MPSQSRRAFRDNSKDVERLLKIARHNADGPDTDQAVNKAAIVLITAFWEAYCEDIAAEGLEHVVVHANDFEQLPKKLRQDLARELKEDKNELAVWDLAGDGWRDALTARLEAYTKSRNRLFNTPKPSQIDELFEKALGIPRMSDAWKVRRPRHSPEELMTADEARTQLTEFVELRGAIAHRGYADADVQHIQVRDYFELVGRIVGVTGGRVNTQVENVTGVPLWTKE